MAGYEFFFKNLHGVGQTYPLSALLFVLSVEIMALLIRNNKDITGFQIKIDEQTHGIKISGWHTTVFNSKNDRSVATFSDSIVNRNKTEGLWIGKLTQSKNKVEHISWTSKPIQSLGIYFGHDKIKCEKLNWENKIDKMNSLFLPCSKRNLSMLH